MSIARTKYLTLIVLFLGIIFAVPLVQALLDLMDGDAPQALELFDDAPSEKHLRAFENDLEESSAFEEHLRPAFQYARYITTRDLGQKALSGEDGWYFYHPGVKYLTEPYFRDLLPEKQPKDDPVETIADFAKQLKAKGIHLIVIPIPGKASVYPERLFSWAEPSEAIHANTNRFRQELTDKGIETIDVHGLFSKAKKENVDLYMPADTHWTGEGVIRAAKLVADRIKKESWFAQTSSTATASYQRTKLVIDRPGDVLEMSKLPKRDELFAKDKVTCYQITRNNQPYEDDEKSPVLWLGDSFSRVFETDDPKNAGIIANLAHELGMPIASIVNDGGASTLVRQQLVRNIQILDGKRLVIWEFIERDIRFGMQGWQKIELWPEGG